MENKENTNMIVAGHHLFGPSSLQRRELCPGSWRLEQNLKPYDTEDSTEGTRLHDEIAKQIEYWKIYGYDAEKIEDDFVRSAFMRFMDIYQPLQKQYFSEETRKIETEIHTEFLLVYKHNDGSVLYSGKSDVIIICPDKVIIIDWKFGRREVEEAEDNTQGMGYALAAMQMFGKSKAEVYFFNPVIRQFTHCEFDDKSILDRYIHSVIEDCMKEDAPLVPGPVQCRYCKAAHYGTCPELSAVTDVVIKSKDALPEIGSLSDDELCILGEKAETVKGITAAITDEIKRRAMENGKCGNYTIREISGGKEITDIQRAFEIVNAPVDRFMEVCSVPYTKLESLFLSLSEGRFRTKKEGKEVFADMMQDIIQEKPTKKMLVKA